MILRISTTGWVYHEAPFAAEELEDAPQPARLPQPAAIALERFAAGRHALTAVSGGVQIGWCVKRDEGWYIEDMDCKTLAGPFRTLAAATGAGQQVFAHEAGASNPG